MTTPSTPSSPSTAAQIRHSLRPWFPDFISVSSLSFPTSFPQLSSRFQKNLHSFPANYLLIVLLIFLLTLIPNHLFTLIILLIIIAISTYLIFGRSEPLIVFDFEINERLIGIAVSVVTVLALALTSGIWWNVILSVSIAAGFICLHAILRTSDNDMESPYAAVLSMIDEDEEHAQGPYTLV
ncbi:PRA1 family protein D-like [Rutidosis leptorrhynchoides]|uniref:PRA1 family protein D-like n=1 Tax=Rutidosis leptorrhynchoides TaxID=125765 RepID=UPI003A9A4E95